MTVTQLVVELLQMCDEWSLNPAHTEVRLEIVERGYPELASSVSFNKDDNGDVRITARGDR